MSRPFLSLIIPAYNEESRLPATLEAVAGYLAGKSYSYEVLVIENGSTDATFEIAEAFGQAHPHFRVVQIDERGKGLAIGTGMLAARGEWRMMLDADLSMPVQEIGRFFPPALEGYEIAIASREALGAKRYDEPDFRHIGGRFVNLLIRLLVLPGIQDSQCGFKSFRGDVADELFAQQHIEGWAFDVEILYTARQRGYRIAELGIPWYYHEFSHVRPIQDTWHMFWDLVRIRLNALRGRYAAPD